MQLVASLFRRLAVLLAAVMVFGGAARAAEPVSVTAREYSLWDGRRLFLAEGDVTVRYGEAVITADFMTYDAEARYAVFEGNVVYVDDERELVGGGWHTISTAAKPSSTSWTRCSTATAWTAPCSCAGSG